jgi:hypothetical protein
MEKNEIKKELYKQNPEASLLYIRKGVVYYEAILRIKEHVLIKAKKVFFEVPISDMGDADLLPQMDAKLLIRYLVDDNDSMV